MEFSGWLVVLKQLAACLNQAWDKNFFMTVSTDLGRVQVGCCWHTGMHSWRRPAWWSRSLGSCILCWLHYHSYQYIYRHLSFWAIYHQSFWRHKNILLLHSLIQCKHKIFQSAFLAGGESQFITKTINSNAFHTNIHTPWTFSHSMKEKDMSL